MIVIVDADPIVYRCGFASETTNWHIVYEDAIGNVEEILFEPTEKDTAGALMREWLDFNEGKITVLDKSRHIVPDPVSYALRATKVQIESIMEECEKQYKEPGKMVMYISGSGGSYRDKIAAVRPYKGNRDPTHKPYHYNAIREYLREHYGSYVTRGIEADDAVSIFAHQLMSRGGESWVVATIDKDLDQIPGRHYNYMNKVHYAITDTAAERWFAFQCLAGDITDNVLGAWKCGPRRAESLLAGLRESLLAGLLRDTDYASGTGAISAANSGDGADSESSAAGGVGHANDGGTVQEHSIRRRSPIWWPIVLREYADSQRRPACPYAQNNPEAVAIEMAQLVKLQEYPGQLWHPHGDLVVPGFGEEDFDG
jgi:hypothetical protein